LKLHRTLDKKLPTARPERDAGPPRGAHAASRHRRAPLQDYYATQTGNRPFRIKIFCNREERLTESYRLLTSSGLVKEFDLSGCPGPSSSFVGKPRETRSTAAGWR